MQQQHPIDNMMQTTMESIRGMVDVNTVVGAPVMDQKGTTIIPISKVSFGFVAGGGEYAVEDGKQKPVPTDIFPFAGGTGAGVSVQPVGFLVVTDKQVKMLPAQTTGAMERMVELLPQLIEELNAKDEKKKNKIFGKTDDELLDGELQ
ncbi:MAG: GerW family sporulation protein [Eubacteriales bacterium]|nr:GerW family sporulation protein [Eubacteriales bacterium]